MAKEKAVITFYNISKCGFYKYGDKSASYGSLADLMEQIKKWGSNKDILETYLYDPSPDQLPVYLFDVNKLNSSWLITMWNKVPSSNKNVASIAENSKVGNANVVMNKIKKGSLPGFATYFWIVPSENIFATVRFQHLVTAQKAAQEYLEAFLTFASSHAVIVHNEETDTLEHKGFRADPQSAESPDQKIHAYFRAALARRPGQHDLIRKNADNISRVERSTILKLNNADDREWWQKMLSKTGIGIPQKKPNTMRLRYRLSTGITEKDVNNIIQEWEANPDKQSDDFGFVFRGSSDIHWLSKALAREEIEVNIKRSNDEVVDATSLLKEFDKQFQKLIQLAKG